MKVYRCKFCGYLHVASVPDKCPMCGAPASAFSEYQVPDISGTKTAENLAAAFAGESQANRKYTLWRQIAEDTGASAETLAAFDRPLAEETAHALSHAAYLGFFGDSKENFANAADGEHYETSEMYPEFAKTAEEEGFPEIAEYLRKVGMFEAQHEAGYRKALESL